ncbi:MAG: substrate-binding domain-containing protein [Leifsonia sp.]
MARVPLDADGAVEALAPLLRDAASDLVGVCCYNDDVAFAVLAATRSLSLRVPEDVTVIGVDATAVGQLASPRLSTAFIDQTALMDSTVRETGSAAQSTDSIGATPTPEILGQMVALVRSETT